ncbi:MULTISPECIES: flagellar hook-length control protein FliK [Halocynthiibacter]|uniref:Flagellar hook-length control protein FliK n=1 Tax=Halocynthiibacter halioticoli TaxID=2986804 RepID=A0AAE3LP83_9RHOB|nr:MULTISPECIES: flagellar hook-length control protein FliK [Halocynthiibacter]MCV6823062.1 flagellar hook-length control protein FliK [Halocynthiibacter halioticoli]MCW4056063.1 flagellar hook-length control protein FliK [Halocynthiibacter sp. SDUM655004]
MKSTILAQLMTALPTISAPEKPRGESDVSGAESFLNALSETQLEGASFQESIIGGEVPAAQRTIPVDVVSTPRASLIQMDASDGLKMGSVTAPALQELSLVGHTSEAAFDDRKIEKTQNDISVPQETPTSVLNNSIEITRATTADARDTNAQEQGYNSTPLNGTQGQSEAAPIGNEVPELAAAISDKRIDQPLESNTDKSQKKREAPAPIQGKYESWSDEQAGTVSTQSPPDQQRPKETWNPVYHFKEPQNRTLAGGDGHNPQASQTYKVAHNTGQTPFAPTQTSVPSEPTGVRLQSTNIETETAQIESVTQPQTQETTKPTPSESSASLGAYRKDQTSQRDQSVVANTDASTNSTHKPEVPKDILHSEAPIGISTHETTAASRPEKLESTAQLDRPKFELPKAPSNVQAGSNEPQHLASSSLIEIAQIDDPQPRETEIETSFSRIESSASAPTTSSREVAGLRPETPRLIVQQLAQSFPHEPNRPIEIALSPEELGKVRLTLLPAEHGMMLSIVAERPETLDLMRRNIEMLSQGFQSLGYESTAFSFSQSGSEHIPDQHRRDQEDISDFSASTKNGSETLPPRKLKLGSAESVDYRV